MHTDPLENLKIDYERWRAAHRPKRKPISNDLPTRTIELLKSYPKSKICKTLGINQAMVVKWQGRMPEKKPSSQEFLELALPAKTLTPAAKVRVIDLVGKAGEKMHLEGEFTISDITELTKAFMEGQR